MIQTRRRQREPKRVGHWRGRNEHGRRVRPARHGEEQLLAADAEIAVSSSQLFGKRWNRCDSARQNRLEATGFASVFCFSIRVEGWTQPSYDSWRTKASEGRASELAGFNERG